jgi:hypothetical protein
MKYVRAISVFLALAPLIKYSVAVTGDVRTLFDDTAGKTGA